MLDTDLPHYDATDPPQPPADELAPVRISHRVDDIFHDGALEQHYNYLVYEFDGGHTRVQAKAYLDEIDDVEIVALALSSEPFVSLHDEPVDPRILTYLRRRYVRLKRWSQGAGRFVPID